MLPNYLTEIITNMISIHDHDHDYDTRNSEFNFALSQPKTNSVKNVLPTGELRLGIIFL